MINTIKQNPFNVLGILANANQRVISQRNSRIKALQKVGKEIRFEDEINIGEKPGRSEDEIKQANAQIQLLGDRVAFSLFWFVNKTHLDKTAIEHLLAGDLYKAQDIWERTTLNKDLNSNNFSAFSNLGTLRLINAINNSGIDFLELKNGINLKESLIESLHWDDFIKIVADDTYGSKKEQELERFISTLIQDALSLNGGDETKKIKLIKEVSSISPRIQIILSNKFAQPSIQNIERLVSSAKNQRIENTENLLSVASKLINSTQSDIGLIGLLINRNDLKFKSSVEKIAKEVLQCGIDYFNDYRESTDDPEVEVGYKVIEVFRKAKNLAVNQQLLERIDQSIDAVNQWIEQEPERKRQALIQDDMLDIANSLKSLQNSNNSISNALSLLNNCKQPLNNIKTAIGAYDDLYLNISTAVASKAQGIVVSVVNDAMEKRNKHVEYQNDPRGYLIRHIENRKPQIRSIEEILGGNNTYYPSESSYDLPSEYPLYQLTALVKEAWEATKQIGLLDMHTEQRNHYTRNKESLKKIGDQLGIFKVYPSTSQTGNYRGGSNDWCYIATMAYGSYEHPNVIVLRRFRDESLLSHKLGKRFVSFYYKYSPKLVEILQGKEWINSTIRKILNLVVNILK